MGDMTPNQVVAWNLWQERKRRGWSQEEVSARLAEHGVKWEKATYYAIEASRSPNSQPRRFGADELLAFSLVFKQPVAVFFTPPKDATLVLADEPLSRADLLQMGLQIDLADLRPLAERLREVATAIEIFEEGRQPESGAARIVEQATAPQPGDEFAGETGKRRLEREVEDARQWRIQQGLDPDDPAKQLPPTEEEERGSA